MPVLYGHHDGITILKLNDPQRRNALSRASVAASQLVFGAFALVNAFAGNHDAAIEAGERAIFSRAMLFHGWRARPRP
jgi:hypothetical protein